MDDNKFDNEFTDLYKKELKKSPYSTESIDKQMGELVESFLDHYTAIIDFENSINIKDFLDNTKTWLDDDEINNKRDNKYSKQLNRFLKKDLRDYPDLISEEIEITGEGLYIEETGDNYEDMIIMKPDEKITGDFSTYFAEPAIAEHQIEQIKNAPNAERDDSVFEFKNNALGVWLAMRNVEIIDGSGFAVSNAESILVPINQQNVKFHKVLRKVLNDTPAEIESAISTELPESLEDSAETNARNKSKLEKNTKELPPSYVFRYGISDDFNQIENNLNYGHKANCSGVKNRTAENSCRKCSVVNANEDYQEKLKVLREEVDYLAKYRITTKEAIAYNGSKIEINNELSQYISPVIGIKDNIMRVFHAFELLKDNEPYSFVHILPEDLIEIVKD